MLTFYVDLNPDYPSRYARRWRVFYRREGDATPHRTYFQFASRKAAERCALKLADQERDTNG